MFTQKLTQNAIVIPCGDFNAHHGLWTRATEKTSLISLIESLKSFTKLVVANRFRYHCRTLEVVIFPLSLLLHSSHRISLAQLHDQKIDAHKRQQSKDSKDSIRKMPSMLHIERLYRQAVSGLVIYAKYLRGDARFAIISIHSFDS